MFKYALACCLMLGLGLSADAQTYHPHHPPVVVQHRLQHTHRHYTFRYVTFISRGWSAMVILPCISNTASPSSGTPIW
jgi:hypothetical protein